MIASHCLNTVQQLKGVPVRMCCGKGTENAVIGVLQSEVGSPSSAFVLVLIYRPPPLKKNKLTIQMFLEEFSQLAEIVMEDCTHPLAIVGDFNFHSDTPNNQDALKFNDLLDSMHLVQHVKGSTHRHGHTFDLIITRREEKLIANVQVLPDVFSDHKVAVSVLWNND